MSEQTEINWDYPDNVTTESLTDLLKRAQQSPERRVKFLKPEHLTIKEPLVQDDISATLAQRGGRYGQFKDHAKIAQGVQDVLRSAPNWDKLDPDMRQALSVIADKMARILNGDPYYDDNWHDIQGYSKLVEDRIKQERGA